MPAAFWHSRHECRVAGNFLDLGGTARKAAKLRGRPRMAPGRPVKAKFIGRDPACELLLADPAVSRRHASVERDAEGFLWITDLGSSNGTFLSRNRQWLQVKKATLCVGDSLRFGNREVGLDRIAALFGDVEGVRLRPLKLPSPSATSRKNWSAQTPEEGEQMHRPRRNPLTGTVEDDPAE